MKDLVFKKTMEITGIKKAGSVDVSGNLSLPLYVDDNCSFTISNDGNVLTLSKIPLDFTIDFRSRHPEYKNDNMSDYVHSWNGLLGFRRKEPLLAFILEYRDYLLRKAGKEETESQKYGALLKEINKSVIVDRDVPFTIDSFKGYRYKGQGRHIPIIERVPKTESENKLFSAMLEFDKAVNPFLNDDYTKEEIVDNFDERSVWLSDHPEDNTYYLTISQYDNANGSVSENCAYSNRSRYGYKFGLECTLADGSHLDVKHVYTSNVPRCENIMVEHRIGTDGTLFDLMVDRGLIAFYKDGKCTTYKATQELIGMVIAQLNEATEYAKKITLGNIHKVEKGKKTVTQTGNE